MQLAADPGNGMAVGVEELAFVALLAERAHTVNFETRIVDEGFAMTVKVPRSL